jgi:hypothetical protein
MQEILKIHYQQQIIHSTQKQNVTPKNPQKTQKKGPPSHIMVQKRKRLQNYFRTQTLA